MKKYFFCVFAVMCFCTWATAQNITKMEYFIDTDPGYGSGINVAYSQPTPGLASADFGVSLPNGLSSGFHFLSIRAKNANNNWSLVAVRPFYKEILTDNLPNITAMEYFIDNDLGYGFCTLVTGFTAGTSVTKSFEIPLPNTIANGFHFLSVRTKDVNNNWSVVAVKPFYKETLPTGILPNIIAMEYFIDNDLGYGLCTPAAIGSDITIALPNTISDGFHFLSLRAKDANNNWSIVAVRPFYKETITTASIDKIEYFIDNDPGTNNGTNVNITGNRPISSDKLNNQTQALSSTEVLFPVLPANMSNGLHKLSIRVRDTNNNWGIVQIKEFTVQDNTIVISNSPAEMCLNTPFNIPFTITGTYSNGNIFTVQLSDINGSFSNPTTIGTLSSTAAGTISAIIPNGTTAGNNYQIRVISSTPSITNATPVNIRVLSTSAPVASTNATSICFGQSATLTATDCAGIINWSNNAGSGSNITVSPTSSSSYSAICTENSCTSNNSNVVNINVITITAPTSQAITICSGNVANLSATDCAGTINWYNSNSGTTILASTSNFTTPILSNTINYYVSCTQNTCESSRTVVVVTVNPTPTVSVNNQTICSGSNTTLTASNCAGNVTWNTGASGSVLSLTNLIITTIYTATCTIGSCTVTNSGTVTVNPTPTVAVNNQTICAGSNTTLTASNCAGTVTWNTGASGSVLSLTNLTTTTIYTANCTLGSCTATNSGTVTVNPNPTVAVNNQTICSGNNTSLTASNCTGTVNWNTGASGSVLSLTNLTTTTTYTATCTLGSCTATNSGTVTVNPAPTVSVNNQTICSGNNTSLTASNCTGTVNWNTGASGSVLSLTNLTTTTTYTATCTLSSCTATNSGTVTVNPSPCTPPCVSLLTLLHPADDILSGNITKQASATSGGISATNFVQGNGTRATYQAKTITLSAGFRAENGVVFKAEIGGCSN